MDIRLSNNLPSRAGSLRSIINTRPLVFLQNERDIVPKEQRYSVPLFDFRRGEGKITLLRDEELSPRAYFSMPGFSVASYTMLGVCLIALCAAVLSRSSCSCGTQSIAAFVRWDLRHEWSAHKAISRNDWPLFETSTDKADLSSMACYQYRCLRKPAATPLSRSVEDALSRLQNLKTGMDIAEGSIVSWKAAGPHFPLISPNVRHETIWT